MKKVFMKKFDGAVFSRLRPGWLQLLFLREHELVPAMARLAPSLVGLTHEDLLGKVQNSGAIGPNSNKIIIMERAGRRRKSKTIGLNPVQLALSPESVSLCRIRPELNKWRYYRIEVWPDLFGGVLLIRQWGRIGTAELQRFDMHPDAGAAVNAFARIVRAKSKRGYQPRSIF